MKPLVSVIVPLYNAAPYVGEALKSIVASTYRPIEVIVMDDGSKDESRAVAEAFAKTHPEVIVMHQENAGVSAARNHAIREAKGEWILPVDADDKIAPDYISHAMDRIADEVRVISCKAEFFEAKEGEWKLPPYSPKLLARRNMIHIASLFRKADWQRVGGFCEEEIYREDWDFWLSIMALGGTYIRLDEVGLYYRVLPHSRRKKAKDQKRLIVDAINRRHPAYMERYCYAESLAGYMVRLIRQEQSAAELRVCPAYGGFDASSYRLSGSAGMRSITGELVRMPTIGMSIYVHRPHRASGFPKQGADITGYRTVYGGSAPTRHLASGLLARKYII